MKMKRKEKLDVYLISQTTRTIYRCLTLVTRR